VVLMEWDEKKTGLVAFAAMVISFVWMVMTGIGGDNIVPLAVFALSISTMAVLFGDGLKKEE
jgi:hypothetical protein